MAKKFNEMTKEELEAVLNSDSIVLMNAAELNQLRKAAKSAGLLTVQYDNMLGIVINNRTYEEIKNSKNYTKEEKALALEARNEYNKELRTRTYNKLYNAEEIMSRAVEVNGKYHFSELTKGEMDFLMSNGLVRMNELVLDKNVSEKQYSAKEIMSRAVEVNGKYHFDNLSQGEMDFLLNNGIIRMNELSLGKQYNIGQQENRNFSKEIVKDNKNLSKDVQKSAEFWNNLNDNSNGVKYVVSALKDNKVKLEVKEGKKSVFTGIDKGNQGFDVVKRDSSIEPYKIYDLIIKKAKASNPKAKIRIKDNVKDPVARNKILIACAKNNMEPIGNIPEGFDFEALKEVVKDVKDMETINALAENLYTTSDFEVVNEPGNQAEQSRTRTGALLVNQGNTQEIPENRPNRTGALLVNQGNTQEIPENRPNRTGTLLVNQGRTEEAPENQPNNNRTAVTAVPVWLGNGNNGVPGNGNGGNNGNFANGGNGGNSGNGGNGGNGGFVPPVVPTASDSRPVEAPKRPWWKKVRDAVVVGGIALLGFMGVRSCQNQDRLEKKVKDLQEQVDKKSITDCDEVSRLINEKYNDGYMAGLAQGKEDCEDQKKPQPTPVKKTPVKADPVILPGDTIKQPDVIIPGKVIKEPDVFIPGDTIKQPDVIIPGDTIKQPDVIISGDTIVAEPVVVPQRKVPEVPEEVPQGENTPKVTSDWTHGKYRVSYNAHSRMAENATAHEAENATLDLSNPEDFNQAYASAKDKKAKNTKKTTTAWVMKKKSNVHD